MTSTTRWAGPSDYESQRPIPGAEIGPSASVRVTTSAGDAHEFHLLHEEPEPSLGYKRSTPRASVLPTGGLEVGVEIHETFGFGFDANKPGKGSYESVIVFAPGTWETVTGPGFRREAESPMQPASGWWIGLHFDGETDDAESWSYAPVVGWQTVHHNGLPELTAWAFNAATGAFERMDRVRLSTRNWRPRVLTQERPTGAKEWRMP